MRLSTANKHFYHSGKTVYFGDIGPWSKTVINYFEKSGARACGYEENPAEYILEVVDKSFNAGLEIKLDWSELWATSVERQAVKAELARMKTSLSEKPGPVSDSTMLLPYAVPLKTQLWYVLGRGFTQYWRTPSYLYSKIALCLLSVSTCKLSSF